MNKRLMDFRAEIVVVLENQKTAQLREGAPSAKLRADRLSRAVDLLLTHKSELENAISADFGHRPAEFTAFADIAPSVKALCHARKHLKSWMRPSRRRLEFPLGITGASGRVQYQPKGVVGIMSPWNFPINLTFAPLASVLAAGNRAMIKPSEFTPQTSALMERLVARQFDADELHVVNGDADVGAAFSSLPFDHLIFTGSTTVGRLVMQAASRNLVPLTLELGGKSPAIIGTSANVKKAAASIMHGKIFNAGQICIAPDYALLPREDRDAFVEGARNAVEEMFPSGLKDNDDYTSVAGLKRYDRLQGLIQDAREKGAEIIELNPMDEDFSQQPHHKLPPTLILDATDEMTVMQEEIFGPLLPVRFTQSTAEAVAYVNEHPRPLALYFFGGSKREEALVLENTTSGGVTVNDTIMHVAHDDLPFGGVGASGMGRYHGYEGFLEFSHHKSVYRQMPFDMLKFLRPPYGRLFNAYIKSLLRG